nr:hypothetical protein [Tanacetum cinerariifolium]
MATHCFSKTQLPAWSFYHDNHFSIPAKTSSLDCLVMHTHNLKRMSNAVLQANRAFEITNNDVEDVRREIETMHHLP